MAARTPPWVCHEGDVLSCWRADRECGRKGSALRLLNTAASPSLNMRDSLHGDGTHGFIVGLFIRL